MLKFPTNNLFSLFAPKTRHFSTGHKKQSAADAHKKINMLVLDGGGIRGIISGERLVTMEKKLREKLKNPNLKLGEVFNYIAGTSTGSIWAAGLTKRSSIDITKPEFSAEEVMQLYLDPKNRKKIFTPKSGVKNMASQGIKISTLNQLDVKLATLYKHEPLEELLKEKFGDAKLSEAAISDDLVIPSYNISINQLVLFTKTDAQKHNKSIKLSEVVRASSAAPTFFDAANINNQFYIDGGMVANNPCMAMAGIALSRYRLDQLFCVSFGTGIFKGEIYPKSGGDITWVRAALDISINGTGEANDELAKFFFLPDKYHRFQVKLKQNLPLDGIQPHEIRSLLEAATLQPKEEKKLDLVCTELAERYLYNKKLEKDAHDNQQHEERMPWLSGG